MRQNKIKYKETIKVINLANDLSAYTLRLLCNENLFPKRSRWIIAGKIADLVNDFHSSIHTANEIRVSTKAEAEDRHRYQTLAMAQLQAIEEKIELAKAVLDFDVDRLDHWAGMWLEEEKLLRSWISKDQKRYSGL